MADKVAQHRYYLAYRARIGAEAYNRRGRKNSAKYRNSVVRDMEWSLKSLLARARCRWRHGTRVDRECTISIDYLKYLYAKQGGKCPISGRELMPKTSGPRLGKPDTISLDRINNSLGYIPGNVRLVTLGVNIALGTWGLGSFVRLCKDVVSQEVFDYGC